MSAIDQKVGDRNRGDDADDCNHDQKFDQGETTILAHYAASFHGTSIVQGPCQPFRGVFVAKSDALRQLPPRAVPRHVTRH
jgi:hypothetical protein